MLRLRLLALSLSLTPATNLTATASSATPAAMYTLDGYGGIHPDDGSPAVVQSAYWPGWKIARSAAVIPSSPGGGYVLDGYGGLHPTGSAPPPPSAENGNPWGYNFSCCDKIFDPPSNFCSFFNCIPSFWMFTNGYVVQCVDGTYSHSGGVSGACSSHGGESRPLLSWSAHWPGWDIARDVVLSPNALLAAPHGYTLDGYGGIHPFGGAPPVSGAPYFGFDIAKRIVLLSSGAGGYVLDGYGGLHPFTVGTNPLPPPITNASYWPGFNIAWDVALSPGSSSTNMSGVTLDGYGRLHPFGTLTSVQQTAYWPGWDIARAVRLSSSSTVTRPSGWLLDGYGGPPPIRGNHGCLRTLLRL